MTGGKLGTAYYELIPSMKGAQQQISSVLSPASSAAGSQAGSSIGSMLLGGLKKFAGPVAVLAAGFSVKKIMKDSEQSFMDLVGATNALQRVAGGTKEQVSGMRAAMQLSGVDANGASGALTIFSKNLGNAAGDSEKAAAMQQKLGTAFLDAAGHVKPMAEILPGLADKFKSMPDGAEKTALATQLFGRSGAQMLPFLNKGSEGIGQLTDKAKQMGLVIDDVSAKAFGAAKSSIRDYNMSLDGLKATLGGNLLPITTAFGNVYRQMIIPVIQAASGFLAEHRGAFLAVGGAVQSFADKVGGLVSGGLAKIGPAFSAVGAAIGPVFSGIAQSVGPMFASLGPAFSQLLPPLVQLWSNLSPVSLILKVIAPIIPTIVSAFTSLATVIAGSLMGVVKTLVPLITQLVTMLAGVLAKAVPQLVPIITMLANVLSQVLQAVMPLVSALVSALVPVISAVIAAIMPLLEAILPPLVAAFNAILPPVLEVVNLLVSMLIPVINALSEILTGLINFVVGVFTGNWSAAWAGVQQIFKGFYDYVGSIINNVVKVFQGIPKIIGDVFSGAGKWLWDAGANIVNGLIDGIKSMAGSIGKWFLSIIPDWIKAPFMAALGIHSPSRVFKQYGQFTMQGFIDGLTEMRPAVQAVAGQVGTLSGPGKAAGLALAGGTGAQVNVQNSIRMFDRDPRIVGAQIGRGIEAALHG